jgi:hypothetical protein
MQYCTVKHHRFKRNFFFVTSYQLYRHWYNENDELMQLTTKKVCDNFKAKSTLYISGFPCWSTVRTQKNVHLVVFWPFLHGLLWHYVPPFLTLRISHKSYRKKSAYSSVSLLSFDVWRIYERVYLEWYMCVEGYKNVSLFPASHCYFFVSVPSYNVPFFFPVKLLNNN